MLATTVPLTVLGAYAFHSETVLRRSRAEETALNLAEVTASGVAQFVTESRLTLQGIASRPAIRSLSRDSCEGFISEANAVLSQYRNLFVTRADGSLVCTDLPPPEGEWPSGADTDWFESARRSGGFVIGRPQLGRLSRVWVSVFAHPVVDSTGSAIGYVGASVDLERFQALLRTPGLVEGSVITLAHTDRTVVGRSEDAATWVGSRLPSVEGGEDHAALGRGVNRTRGLEGTDRVWGFTRVAGTDWMVYAGLPTEWVYAGLFRRVAIGIGIGGLLLLIVAVLARRIYRSATGSLHDLVECVRRAGRRERPDIPDSGPAEVMAVARAFERALADRDAAEQALRRSDQRYESIFEHALFGIYVSTPDGQFVEANPAMARILGYDSPAELVQRPVDDLYADPGQRDRLVAEALAGEPSGTADVQWRRKDGKPVQVRLYWNTILDEEGEIAFEVLAEDLTERRALEEQFRQAQKLEAVGRLAGGVAHDFNNRLTVIRGQAEILLVDLPEGDPMRASVLAIAESAERAAALTSQLLAFSRKQVARPRVLELNRVVENLGKVLHRVMGEDIEIVTRLEPGLPPVFADPGQIEQILLNLCTNARDAMPDGGVLILGTSRKDVTATERHSTIEAGEYVSLSVADTGHGMEEAVRARLFEPFFTTKPEGKGTGLGLSTVYGLVAQSEGSIHVVSELDRGSSFEILLPVAEGTPVHDPKVRDALPMAEGEDVTILVAEDEDAVRSVLVRCLGRAGYNVIQAVDGENALAVAESHDGRIDLLLTDIVMPGIKGPELADRLTESRPDLPVLFVSGYSDETPVTDGRAGTPRDFLPKPFTPLELLRSVQDLLARAARAAPPSLPGTR